MYRLPLCWFTIFICFCVSMSHWHTDGGQTETGRSQFFHCVNFRDWPWVIRFGSKQLCLLSHSIVSCFVFETHPQYITHAVLRLQIPSSAVFSLFWCLLRSHFSMLLSKSQKHCDLPPVTGADRVTLPHSESAPPQKIGKAITELAEVVT